uniref:Uncharacterized protein n=1 Tax=Kwoniella bestiolae CBS 10118 TaxID=1296100 RepID=A0A1B9G0L2_9TREE|nr:hypothetical protein I302_06025 [Kwoniella bestiolae CBS 10118]OCF24564.1 hypothetical protein I302_06025 [Kwoniella bestiolae CBS 10118]
MGTGLGFAGSQASKNIGIPNPNESSSASIKSFKKVMRLRGGCDDCCDCDKNPGP